MMENAIFQWGWSTKFFKAPKLMSQGLGKKKCTELEKMYRENQPKMYRDCKYFSRVFGIWRKTPRFQRCEFSGEILSLAFYLHAEQNKNGFPPISIIFFYIRREWKRRMQYQTTALHTHIYIQTHNEYLP